MAGLSARIDIRFNKLPNMDRRLHAAVKNIVSTTALQCEGLAKVKCPVDTGALRNSIQAQPESELAWTVAPGQEYAWFVEAGTVNQPAQPYLTPAAEAVRGQFFSRMQDAADGAV
mgnify:CR=1 FL=1